MTRGNHIINDDHGLSGHVGAQIFRCNHRIIRTGLAGIVMALIEGSHIHTKDICKVNGTAHASFVRAYNHKVFTVYLKFRLAAENIFKELICGLENFKACIGNGILNPYIMSVEGYDVVYAHPLKLLKGIGAVKRFTAVTFHPSAFIKVRHYYIYASCSAAYCSNDSL